MVAAIAGKLWLVRDLEIADALDDPHEYVLQVLYPFDGGLAYPPGTGAVGEIFYRLGVSYHFGIEALYLGACGLLLAALGRSPWRDPVGLGLFLFMAFDPAPTELMSHFMSDPVWLVETMAGGACLMLALREGGRRSLPWLGGATLLLGLSALTRSVAAPLAAGLLGYLFFGWLVARVAGKSARENWNALRPAVLAVATVLLSVCGLIEATCFLHAQRNGFWGLSALDSREYRSFYTCLQGVGAADGPPYFPVDAQRRQLIRQAGSQASAFIDLMETDARYKKVGREIYGRDDFPAGWFHFVVFGAGLRLGHGNLVAAFTQMRDVEQEIHAAEKAGRLPHRFILPLPDSRLGIVLRCLPASLLHVTRQTLAQPDPTDFAQPPSRQFVLADFSRALHRQPIVNSPARERIRAGLAVFYRLIYGPWLIVLFAASLVTLAVGWWTRPQDEKVKFPIGSLPLIFFFVFAGWYALFDASGLAAFTRYMIYQNVLLPVLTLCQLLLSWRWWASRRE